MIKEFFKPLICKGDKPIYLGKELIFPKEVAFEFRFMIDMLFFGLLFIFLLYLYYGSIIQGLFSLYAIYVCVFWTSAMIGNMFLIPFIKKNKKI